LSFVDDNAEQIVDRRSAITVIGAHLELVAGSVLQDVKFPATHAVFLMLVLSIHRIGYAQMES
jgi:hypothetical protein